MRPQNSPLAVLVVAGALCLGGSAEASGRRGTGPSGSIISSTSSEARKIIAGGSPLVAEATRWLGAGKFTRAPGPWCADAVSFWLMRVGRPPLANRLAASALAYGPRVAAPRPGDLIVLRTRRGSAGHVGIVEAVEPDGSVAIIFGNWAHRVARALIPRRAVTAFVRT